ncbi:MAG TPA: D-alanyl-D-alanine carboxypeptidase/D-alanyl-D-alanine-endopeptidase [Terriglobia bacterium]|nr:D-alanyl-D-alanine carboxypeptidase/D-alanyl-D-alanine-endopeptidase [Terriglobia bacterium]
MSRTFFLFASLLTSLLFRLTTVPALAQEATPTPPQTVAELQEQLTTHISQPRFAAALWGVKIVSRDSGKIVFEHNPQKLFSPASNSKLYTVALALDRLGADYRIKTSLYSQRRPDHHGVLKGDLIIYGRGDPTINARLHGNDIYQALEPLVAAVTNTGIKRIDGDLIGDDSFFRGPPFGSGWAWDDMENSYGAEISALTINDNSLQIAVKPAARPGERCRMTLIPSTPYLVISNRTETAEPGTRRSIAFYRPIEENVVYASGKMAADDSEYKDDVTIHNPGALFVSFFREALASHGISVRGKNRALNWLDREISPFNPDKLIALGTVESLRMGDVAREIMKPSQNLYTDLILAHVGESQRTPGNTDTSEDFGIRELGRFLAEAGVRSDDVFFEEGSGLSRNNLTTPNATIALLQHMHKHKCAEAYLSALPVAGVDGTLRNRMKDTPAQGNVRAKTGTLRWANSLSGHVTTAAGEHLLFSIMLNRYHAPRFNRSTRNDIDAIPILLASFTGRTDK